MLSQCANQRCGKPFLKLREGKLFVLETEFRAKPGETTSTLDLSSKQRTVERFWLCADCATVWTLVYEHDGGIALAPLRRPVAGAASAASVIRGVVA
jgi:hypothetical protein